MAESKRLDRLLAKPVIGTESQVITLTRPATFTTTSNRRQPTWRQTGPTASSSETLNNVWLWRTSRSAAEAGVRSGG